MLCNVTYLDMIMNTVFRGCGSYSREVRDKFSATVKVLNVVGVLGQC